MSERWGEALANDSASKVQENRLRRVADRQGLRLSKNRRRDKRAADYGIWYLTDEHDQLVFQSDDLRRIAEELGEAL